MRDKDFNIKVHRAAESFRNKKKKELLNKKNPTKLEKEIIKSWDEQADKLRLLKERRGKLKT